MISAHPSLPEFDYIKPQSLKEASEFLAGHPDESRPFMGGTDTFVRMRDGFWKDKYLVDVKGLDGMNLISFDAQKGLTIGAAVNMNKAAASPIIQEHYPLLAEAAQSVASYQLRNRATICGNICNASPAGDTTGACLVYEGTLKVYGVNGYREETLAAFFKGPGKTVLKPGDVVISINLPIPPKGSQGKYWKLGRNKTGDLAIVGVAVLGYPDSKTTSGYGFRIALASVAATPFIPKEAEKILSGEKINDQTIEKAAVTAMNSVKPIDDVRGSALYRKMMVRNLTHKAILDVWSALNRK